MTVPVLEALVEGQSLRTTLWPKQKYDPGMPEHIEGFDLPHVVAVGDLFWGRTPTVHNSRGGAVACSFCYPSAGGVLCSFMPTKRTGHFIHTARYHKRQWRLMDNYYEVWNSDSWADMMDITDAVESGRRLKVAMLDEHDVWDINPVHLPMVNPGWFRLLTEVDYYPAWFRSPTWVKDIAAALTGEFSDSEGNTTIFQCDTYPSWYDFSPDGTFRGGLSQDVQHYKRLRVFAERAYLQP